MHFHKLAYKNCEAHAEIMVINAMSGLFVHF